MGLAFDESDIEFYFNMFVNELKRNPTTVELFDLSQSNSEHSRYLLYFLSLLTPTLLYLPPSLSLSPSSLCCFCALLLPQTLVFSWPYCN